MAFTLSLRPAAEYAAGGGYTYAHTDGTMPAGLSLAGSVIQGTTNEAIGNYNVTITATSSANPACVCTLLVALKVRTPAVPLALQPDYDGDGQADLPVWKAETGEWLIRDSRTGNVRAKAWGAGYAPYSDVPAGYDYDGDGQADIAVYRPDQQVWYMIESRSGQVKRRRTAVRTPRR